MWNLKKEQMKIQKRNRVTHTQNILVVAIDKWGEGKIGEGDKDLYTSNYKIN